MREFESIIKEFGGEMLIRPNTFRRIALAMAARYRPGHKWTRVSKATLARENEDVLVRLKRRIDGLPACGKTI